MEINPDANEIRYHTPALTSVFSLSDKLGNAYCMIPIYSNHLNLGFNKGTLLEDPQKLLSGTGNLIRHIPVRVKNDFENQAVRELMDCACLLALASSYDKPKVFGQTISKIK